MTVNWDVLQPTDPALLYRRDDPHDIRLGERTHTPRENFSLATYASARTVLLGCPQDEGVRRNKGRPGAAQAPDAIRAALYKLAVPDPAVWPLVDLGNLKPQSSLEASHDAQQAVIAQLIRDGKRVISLGGGNDLSYADCAGLCSVVAPVLAINVDAHYDVRADAPRNSGTPYRQLLDEGWLKPQNFWEVASVPMLNSPAYRAYLYEQGAHIIDLPTLSARGIAAAFADVLANPAPAIFWGLDMDAVRAADAPGVSAPNPLGLTAHEFCAIAALAGADARSRVFEITEVNPAPDIDGRTARLAAAAIHSFLFSESSEEK